MDKKAVLHQLRQMGEHHNLLYCLAYGRDGVQYGEKLLLTCIKFTEISKLLYHDEDHRSTKVAAFYYDRFFKNYIDCETECEYLLPDDVKDRADLVFDRYLRLQRVAVNMLADPKNTYQPWEFKTLIEAVIDGDDVPKYPERSHFFTDEEYGNYYD